MKKSLFKAIITCLFIGLSTFAVASQNVTGKVLETMDSGGYTYMKVDTGDAQPWVAVPQSKVKVGEEITYQPGMVMNNFASKTLNRTFDSIVFSSGLAGAVANPHGTANKQEPKAAKQQKEDDSFASAVRAEGGTAAPAQQEVSSSGGSIGAIAPLTETKVDKAAGDNAYTVSEIFEKAEDLNGEMVRIQGKVVKFSPMIMGRNWIHLQDGTGDPMTATHDLVITTAEQFKTDDIVTVEGVLTAKKDFGAGYKYQAIVEEAKAVK